MLSEISLNRGNIVVCQSRAQRGWFARLSSLWLSCWLFCVRAFTRSLKAWIASVMAMLVKGGRRARVLLRRSAAQKAEQLELNRALGNKKCVSRVSPNPIGTSCVLVYIARRQSRSTVKRPERPRRASVWVLSVAFGKYTETQD